MLAQTFRSGQSDQKHITMKILMEKALSLFYAKASSKFKLLCINLQACISITYIWNIHVVKRNWMYLFTGKSNNSVRIEDADDVPSFSLNQIALATNNFSPNNKIGLGCFGVVYKVIC